MLYRATPFREQFVMDRDHPVSRRRILGKQIERNGTPVIKLQTHHRHIRRFHEVGRQQ